MTITNGTHPSHMGQYVKDHKPVLNRNTFIHAMYGTKPAFVQQAVITQLKKYPDVSVYQKNIDFVKMYAKTDTIIIRAGQGLWGTDVQFLRNWAESKARAMKRGIYWFFDDRENPLSQAVKIVDLVKNDRPEMEIMIDWETYYGGNYGGIGNVVKLMQEIERLAPWAIVGMYTGYYWFTSQSNPITNAKEYAYLKTRPLWLAWYTSNAADVRIPAPWSSLLLWQFGTPSVGYEYGCATVTLDMNFFNGTPDEFYARYGGNSEPLPPGETMRYKLLSDLNMRVSASTSAAVILALPKDSYVWGVKDTVTNWIHVSQYQRPGGTVTPLDAWCSGYPAYVVEAPETGVKPDLKITVDAGADYPVTVVTVKPL